MVLHSREIPQGADSFEQDVREFAARLSGEVILPSDGGYEEARKIWNAEYDRNPDLIVRPRTAQDVANAVAFAIHNNLPIAVRSGGHGMSGHGTTDDGIVVDLSLMKQIAIDPEERVARAQTGLTWAEYAGHAAQYGLATSSGDMGTVGLGGLTLGGGIGWMVRKHGLTIDHLISAEVVTADGSILRASEDENQDLFWAIRGGGGNFGIVTELELRLQPAPLVVGGGVFYSADEAHEVLRAYTEYASSAPDELTTMASLMAAPPAPFIPVEHQGKPALLILVCYTGDIDEGMKVVAPLRQLGAAIADVVSPMPYPVMFELSKEGGVKGNHHAVRSMFMQDVDDESIDTIVCRYAQATSPHAMVQLRPLGGAMSRVPEDATAFAHRDARYLINLVSSWVEPVGAGQHVEWLRDFWNAIRSKTSGVYVNFLEDEGEARIRDAYKPHTYRRLADIKNRYDPENVFHLNQNIRPKV